MARRTSRTLTEVELEFMQAVWERGEATTEDVMTTLAAQGRPLADGSVRKILSILVRKGYLTRRRIGRAFLYTPTVPEGQARQSLVTDLLKRAFGGSAGLMVATLIESGGVRRKDIKEIKRLIAAHEKEGQR